VFLGTYYHTVDDRNRLSIPKKFRQDLVGGGILTRGLDGCLFLYSKTIWGKIEEKILAAPLTKADARSFSRHVLSGAMEVLPDKLGRILLPTYLKEFSGITNEVAILGVGERIEFWDKQHWDTFSKQLAQNSDEIAERLSESGI